MPLERSDRFFAAVAFGDLAVVVGAPGTVAMANLGDGGHVDGVVESTVAAPRQAEHLAPPLSRGHLDRCGAVVGSEPIPAGEVADVGDVADDRGRDISPIPKISVSVVSDALTAAVIRCLVSRNWSSTRCRSATNSAASS
jgi:hypothetical protein